MLNIFGALGQVARLLPNYVQGQRQAVQDNWADLNQYNQVQAGQLTNMATERTMPWYFNMYADAANNSRIQAYLDAMQGLTKMAGWGGEMETALRSNYWNPQTFEALMRSRKNATNQEGTNAGLFGGDNMGLTAALQQMGFGGQGAQQQQMQPLQGPLDVNARMQQTETPTAGRM